MPLRYDFWMAVLISLLCGVGIGLERQLRGKPLDVRSAVLVCWARPFSSGSASRT
jgi:uncharacterized membrane protein YhiD involved in acid resistance